MLPNHRKHLKKVKVKNVNEFEIELKKLDNLQNLWILYGIASPPKYVVYKAQ